MLTTTMLACYERDFCGGFLADGPDINGVPVVGVGIVALGLLAFALAGLFLVRWSQRPRVAPVGKCAWCRYPVEGLEAGFGPARCPECGNAPKGGPVTEQASRRGSAGTMILGLLMAVVGFVVGAAVVLTATIAMVL